MKTAGSRFPIRIFLAFCLSAAAALFFFVRPAGENGGGAQIGHVIRAWGTVSGLRVKNQTRLETGREIQVPVRIGDRIQTGEDAAAEILFFGGAKLQLQAGSIVTVEDAGDDFAIRLLLGRGFLELPAAESNFSFRAADGSALDVPEGRKLVLGLSALEEYEDAVRVVTGPEENPENLELRALALGPNGDGVSGPFLVPPISDHREEGEDSPALSLLRSKKALPPAPRVGYPENEADLDVRNPTIAFKWSPAGRAPAAEMADPVVGYEISVRPAFGYEIGDGARKTQVFQSRPAEQHELALARVGGTGTFLWSVRAVTASGRRSPAGAPRWLEMRFPKILAAPQLKKPKIQ